MEARGTPQSLAESNSRTVQDRLRSYSHQLVVSSSSLPNLTTPSASTLNLNSTKQIAPTTMSRDPITCHVLNTLTGTPASNLPCTLTYLSATSTTSDQPIKFHATTDSDGRIKSWTPSSSSSSSPPTSSENSVSSILSSLPHAGSKTNWSIQFAVGPWFEAQGVESFWPEVEVKFTVRGRGREGEEGWRHYHVPVLLGPWNYSTYRGS